MQVVPRARGPASAKLNNCRNGRALDQGSTLDDIWWIWWERESRDRLGVVLFQLAQQSNRNVA
jgi:hypothetical protein